MADEDLVVRFSAVSDGLVATATETKAAITSVGAAAAEASAASAGMAKASNTQAAALGRVTSQAGRLDKRLTSFVDRTADKFLHKMRSIGLAIGLVGVALVGMGVKLAMANEQFLIGAERMLGSRKAALALNDDLKKFAARTPFQMTNLRSLSAQLLGQGIGGKDIIPILTGLGDVTSGTGGGQATLERVVANFGQIVAQQRITGRDMRDFASNRIPALAQIAAATKMTTGQVSAMISSKGGGEELYRRLGGARGLAAALGGGKFAGGMEAQSKTFGGMISNLKDKFENSLTSGFEKVLPKLTPLLARIDRSIAPFTDRLANGVADALGRLADFLTKNWNTIQQVVNVFMDFGVNALPVLIDAVRGVLTVVVPMFWVLSKVLRVMRDLGPITSELAAGFAALLIIRKVQTTMEIFTGVLKGVTAAQTASNAAALANPYVLIAVAVIALGVAIYMAWQRSERFRAAVRALGRGVVSVFSAIGRAGASAWGWLERQMVRLWHLLEKVGRIAARVGHYLNPSTWLHNAGALASKVWPFGDTTRPRALAGTMAMAGAVAAGTGGRFQVTSGIRGDNLGWPGSRHTTGQAIDVVGSHLGGLVGAWNRAGGYAAIHGAGSGRHAHLERGDTTYARTSSAAAAGDTFVFNFPANVASASKAEVQAWVTEAWDRRERARRERR